MLGAMSQRAISSFLSFFAALTLVSLVASACGSTSTTASSTPAPTATEKPEATESPTAAATVLPTSTPVPPTSTPVPPTVTAVPATATPVPAPKGIRSGAQVMVDNNFDILTGKRVGLIGNQTSTATVNGVERPLSELLAEAPGIELTALFAPEHGVFGNVDAGVVVGDTSLAGVPVYSLFDLNVQRFAPTADMLANVDVLVYDLQDVGSRTYTFISTMGLSMQAAAQNGKGFVVLDQINPQGGLVVEGFVRTPDQESFISQFPIPLNYGLTAGELAQAIVGQGWIDAPNLELAVVPLDGWTRELSWDDTDQLWIAPSPSLPSTYSTYAYPGTVLFEATTLSVGRGTDAPFRKLGATWIDANALALDMEQHGVFLEPTTFTPTASAEVPNPKYLGMELPGIDLVGWSDTGPVGATVYLLVTLQTQANQAEVQLIDRPETFDLLAGTTQLRTMLENGNSAQEIIDAWQGEVEAWITAMNPYVLY